MSLIAKGVRRVDFEDGEWIEFKNAFSVKEMREIAKIQEQAATVERSSDADFALSLDILDRAIVKWRVLDDDGQEVPYTKDNLLRLDMTKLKGLLSHVFSIAGISETKEEQKKGLPA